MMALTETNKRAISFSKTIDLASLAAGATVDVAVNELNVPAGAAVVVVPPATLEADLSIVGAWTTEGQVTFRVYNPTGLAIDAASASWSFVVLY